MCLPTEVRPDLTTAGRFDYGGALRSPFTAHPKIDPLTGEMHFFGYDVMGPPYLRYHVADASGALVRSVDITIPGPSMVHDFAITERNIVFFDLPVVYDFALLGQQPFPAAWKPDYGARVGVMPRDGGDADVRWSDVELCYVYHPLNAYDDGDRVVVDVVRWPEMFAIDRFGPGASAPPTLDRWTIDAAAGKVVEERLDDRPQELPRVDERRVGRRHRFGYAPEAVVNGPVDDFGQLLQHDLDRGTVTRHDFGPGTAAGEALFVPASPDAAEDEGWVLSVVYDADPRHQRRRHPRRDRLRGRSGRDGAPAATRAVRVPRLLGRGRVARLTQAAARRRRTLTGRRRGGPTWPSSPRDAPDVPRATSSPEPSGSSSGSPSWCSCSSASWCS